MDIKDHGICVGNNRFRCRYCDKEMFGTKRLKFHLGNVCKDVTPCPDVPDDVKQYFKPIAEAEMAQSRIKPQKSIARFFYENYGDDFSAVESPSFKDMMNVCGGGQMELNFEDLNGWMLQDVFKQVHDSVQKIKDSWSATGCTILVDAWVDQRGHDLVSFVADSPAGPVYLKSFDVSDTKHDDDALLLLLNGLIDEVGVQNVTQIIAQSTSGWVDDMGKLFVATHKRPQAFWSVSASHCFKLMVERILEMHSFGDILEKGSHIWKVINKNPSIVRDHSHGKIVSVSSSELDFIKPYLTLETIFKEKKILEAMSASSYWNKDEEGIAISSLVNDSSFWESVERVVRCTSPLISVLLSVSIANNQHVGCTYEKLKEIKKNTEWAFGEENKVYQSFLDILEDIWKKHLRNPLHTAGYYLNPNSFFSNDFQLDQEISLGISSSLHHMVDSFHMRVQIAKELNMYTCSRDVFNEARQADQISGISPAEWWAQKASHYPELQSFAIKILSQTSEGASKYKLKRSLAEKLLLTQGMSHSEKEHLGKLEFVHYNLHLQSCKAKRSGKQ